MNQEVFQNISKIIERESKSTTYKFALLRATTDIILEHSPYIKHQGTKVEIPTGLVIEKWLIYYYNIFSAKKQIPQTGRNTQLVFAPLLLQLIEYYQDKGGVSVFYNDLRNKGIPEQITLVFTELCKQLRNTITTMPMKYIGSSLHANQHYSIYQTKSSKIKPTQLKNSQWLFASFGTFTLEYDYYQVLSLIGSFIAASDNLLFKWAEFSVSVSSTDLSTNSVLERLLLEPITQRQIHQSKSFFQNILTCQTQVVCVWSGKKLTSYDLDHLIPFSIYKNNDLWNLLPASKNINAQKSDKIPTKEKLEQSKQRIFTYWNLLLQSEYSGLFNSQLTITLLGSTLQRDILEQAFAQLISTCEYLTEKRGYTPWI